MVEALVELMEAAADTVEPTAAAEEVVTVELLTAAEQDIKPAGTELREEVVMEHLQEEEEAINLPTWALGFHKLTLQIRNLFHSKRISTLSTLMSQNEVIKKQTNGELPKISQSMGRMYPNLS